ncbi:MAG: phosphate/phosphite/phosphonate ABC transporter substrate-binding protein [Spirochaetales bacterium]|nr:phosphate/phosphite/phosphonate ABC transporter substrate-binding protein [Spirochaetales bacterium]
MKKQRAVALVLMLALAAGVLGASGGAEAPLGSEKNPIVWSFVPSGEMERVASGAQAVADMLYDKTGYHFATNVATEYVGVIEAMATNPPKAHMASLATFAYIMAAERGVADAALVSVRYGSPTYNGQIFVRSDSGINQISDLAGKSFARPDPLSTSGWIIPMITLKAAGINPDRDLSNIVDAGSHDGAVAAVLNGDADAGASYVDARTRVEDDFPNVMEDVAVIEVTTDIPNDGVQFHPEIDMEMRNTIVNALIEIASTEEGKDALKVAYQWNALEEHGDTFYDPFRQLLQASGVAVEDLMK